MKSNPMIGIDLAKNIFQVCIVKRTGKVLVNKAIKRRDLTDFMTRQRPSLVVMEACSGAHYWARRFIEAGHQVRLIACQHVVAFRHGQKNDANDALALTLAVTRSTLPTVPIKSVAQQDMQSLHRVRERAVRNRTALVNQIRGLLSEYGVVIAQGIARLRSQLPRVLEDAENELSDECRYLVNCLYEELVELDQKVNHYTRQITVKANSDEACQRLRAIGGVGPLVSTALRTAIGNGECFTNGRHVSAWLGLVPRQYSSGGKTRLYGISKRGDSYLRQLLIHGARAVVTHAKGKTDAYSRWIVQLVARVGKHKAYVAVANKIARVAWALLHSGERYRQPIELGVGAV
jgi:transposase